MVWGGTNLYRLTAMRRWDKILRPLISSYAGEGPWFLLVLDIAWPLAGICEICRQCLYDERIDTTDWLT